MAGREDRPFAKCVKTLNYLASDLLTGEAF